jgi:orotidine-5'-phosphate decarboxylase
VFVNRVASFRPEARNDSARGNPLAGADYIVVGRPIPRRAQPGAGAQQIIDELEINAANGVAI